MIATKGEMDGGGYGEVTCAVHQRRHGALLRQHAFHSVSLLWMVKTKDVGFTQTESVT